MPTSPQNQQPAGPEAPPGPQEIERSIARIRKLVRQMAKDAWARIRRLADREASS
jgi:hypothetical protein